MIIIQNRVTKEQFVIEPNTIFSIYDYAIVDTVRNLELKERRIRQLEELWARVPMRKCSSCGKVGVFDSVG